MLKAKKSKEIERVALITKWFASLCIEKGRIVSSEEIRDAFNEDIKQTAKEILKLAQ